MSGKRAMEAVWVTTRGYGTPGHVVKRFRIPPDWSDDRIAAWLKDQRNELIFKLGPTGAERVELREVRAEQERA